jgi:hypothetical protein
MTVLAIAHAIAACFIAVIACYAMADVLRDFPQQVADQHPDRWTAHDTHRLRQALTTVAVGGWITAIILGSLSALLGRA